MQPMPVLQVLDPVVLCGQVEPVIACSANTTSAREPKQVLQMLNRVYQMKLL